MAVILIQIQIYPGDDDLLHLRFLALEWTHCVISTDTAKHQIKVFIGTIYFDDSL